MKKLDALNLRWDNDRWKTIIDLNDSLKEGKRNLIELIFKENYQRLKRVCCLTDNTRGRSSRIFGH